MPNDCECELRIGANTDTIQLFCDAEFSFEKLRPVPADQDMEWNYKYWGTKWDRYKYRVVKRGEQGLEIRFNTAWAPPLELCKHLVETYHDVWIKCDWYEEGGTAGVFVVRWDTQLNKLEVTEAAWDDWCLEEWAMRMQKPQ